MGPEEDLEFSSTSISRRTLILSVSYIALTSNAPHFPNGSSQTRFATLQLFAILHCSGDNKLRTSYMDLTS